MILVIYNRLLKITYFITIIEEILAKRLTRLFKNNIWKLYRLLKNIILNKRLYFVVELMKKLNNMLRIETRLLIVFYLQTNK